MRRSCGLFTTPSMLKQPPAEISSGVDILAEFRRRILVSIGAVCSILLLPGAIFIFFMGFQLLGALVAVMLVALMLNGIAAKAGKFERFAMLAFVGSLIAVVGLSIVQRSEIGVFWSFPAVLLITFLDYARWARIYTLAFFVSMSTVMVLMLEPPVSTRGVTALGLTILITNIFLRMIEKLQKRLTEQSAIDPLTGALNRREIDSILLDAIARKTRWGTPASILVLDIDEFKSVNDTYGHAAGDQVLRDLTSLITRRSRIVDRLFRMGGDEFMVYLPDTTSDGARRLAEDVREFVAEAYFVEDRSITVSIGIVELEAGEDVDEWIKRGDQALYAAKQGGRNAAVEAFSEAAYLSFDEASLSSGTH